jgi:hypothetical protein
MGDAVAIRLPLGQEETMTNASLARKLARLHQNYGGVGPAPTPPFANPLDYLAAEQDRRREYLAEELLKILAETANTTDFTDGHAKRTVGEGENAYQTEDASLTVSEWAGKLAHAALAAATVLYPEVPGDGAEIPDPTIQPAVLPQPEAEEGGR